MLDRVSVYFPIGIKDFGISAKIELGEEWQPDFKFSLFKRKNT
jgi:hypothetical protein